MAEAQVRIRDLDPVWTRIRREAEDAAADEPMLGGLIHSSILHHKTLEQALGYRFSQKLATSEMSEQLLREIADRAYTDDPALAEAARADLVAVLDRDPACHR